MSNADLPNLETLLDVPVDVTVALGSSKMTMRDVLKLEPGSLVQLDRLSNAPVDIHVNGKLFAHGEVVVVEGHFGIEITELAKTSS